MLLNESLLFQHILMLYNTFPSFLTVNVFSHMTILSHELTCSLSFLNTCFGANLVFLLLATFMCSAQGVSLWKSETPHPFLGLGGCR